MTISTQKTYQSLKDTRNRPEICFTNHRLNLCLSLVALGEKLIQLLMTSENGQNEYISSRMFPITLLSTITRKRNCPQSSREMVKKEVYVTAVDLQTNK